jgi:1,4-alpha-glucan branching enzyme
MRPGYLALVLHAHLPFVREPDAEDSLEQHWLFEAITETYIPLLLVFDNLIQDGIDFRLTLSITPTLASMLADPMLQSRYVARLEQLIDLAEKEVARTQSDPHFAPLARMYHALFARIYDAFVHRYRKNLLGAFRRFQAMGYIEIMASAATHGYLPLLSVNKTSVRAQIKVGIEHYRQVFGRKPAGFWLPECGYFPGVDDFLDESGIRFTILETHGITRADERPRYGVHAPVYCPSGVAAFGRDPECSRQVWSASEGYPGDYDYREFYRDIGYDLDDGTDTGIKYYRITGTGDRKEPYVREWAERKTEIHAEHFLQQRIKQIRRLDELMDRIPLIVAPYDAELFGHWWFEGPQWLNHLIRKIAPRHDTIRLVTLSEYLDEYPVNQTATPCMSSWGSGGFNEVWLNGKNDWIYPRLHTACGMMQDLAALQPRLKGPAGPASRALNQAARELLLAQASDWAFMINAGHMADYATRRINGHLDHFHRLKEQVESATVDEKFVEALENQDNIFSTMEPAEAFSTNATFSRTVIEPAAVGNAGNVVEDRNKEVETGSMAPLHVVMVCPEIVPFAKTGGLADMTASLALALEQFGHHISLIMPAYRCVLRAGVPIHQTGIRVTASVGGSLSETEVLSARIGRTIKVYFICAGRYFDRDGLYAGSEGDYSDNAERFAFFNRAALELLGKIGAPDVLHAHDWQAALSIAFLKAQPERYSGLASIGTVLTVHNLGYQGLSPVENWRFLDLDRSFFSSEGLEFYGRINLLKAGVVFADAIATVSPAYAEEIQTSAYGFGLEGILQKRSKDLVGILNGADYTVWNPVDDSFLARNFSCNDLSGKQACKTDLQRIFGLPESPHVPLLAMVSRLAAQKGLDLVEAVMDPLFERDIQLVLLGSGDKFYQDRFEAAALRYPERIGLRISFDEALAHKIEGGADIFLMPSRYEPSGLNQLYSMKYGTVPVVRATGGLKDSVEEFDPALGNGTGFLFEAYDGRALLDAIDRALAVFRRKAEWTTLMKNGMAKDYSWSRSAGEYVELYRKLSYAGRRRA